MIYNKTNFYMKLSVIYLFIDDYIYIYIYIYKVHLLNNEIFSRNKSIPFSEYFP